MRTYLRSKLTLLFMTCAIVLAIPAMALADQVANNLDNSVDATVENMNLTAGGANGSAKLYVVGTTQGDTINGCNFKDGGNLELSVSSSNSSVATVNPSQVTISECGENNGAAISVTPLSAGSSTITVTKRNQSTVGGTFTTDTATFQVNVTGAVKQNQTISFAASTPTTKTFGDADFNVSATASSGLPVSYSAKAGSNCTVSSAGLVSITGAGSCTVVASQGGNTNYNAASNVEHTISIGKADTTTTVTCTGGPFSYTGTAQTPCSASVSGPGLNNQSVPVTYTNNTNAGTATASASYGGTANYNGSSGSEDFTIGKAGTTTTVSCDAGPFTYDGTAQTPCSASVSGPGLNSQSVPVTYTNNTNAGTATASASYGGTANYNGSSDSEDFTIGAKSITGSFTAANKVYDGDNSATITGRSLTGVVPSDSANVALTGGTATFNDKNVGTGKTVTGTGFTLAGTAKDNYTLSSVSNTTADITARDLTVSATGVNKPYDGNANATVNLSTNDKVSGDAVTLDYSSASFNDKNVGTGKTVSVSGISISGADAGNYNLTNTTASTTANITAKTVTGSFTAANKVYDGNASATITGRSLSGTIPGDDVSLIGGTATFDSAAVGQNKTVTLTGATLSGADANNYSLSSVNPITTTASILAWTTNGFFAPVDTGGVFNSVKGGSTVPLKFELFAGSELTDPASVKSLTYSKVNCDGTAPVDEIETLATGGTSLRYDSTSGQYIYNWKTPTGAGCYKATVTAQDGTTINAFFKTR